MSYLPVILSGVIIALSISSAHGSWHAVTDTRRIMDVIKMFFDELEWFGMLDFQKIPVDSD